MIAQSEKVSKILKDLQASTPDIEASALVSVDGAMITSELSSNIEETKLVAMTAAMVSLGEKSAQELTRGELKQMYVKGDNGHVLLTAVGEEAVLVGKVRENAKMGLVFLNMKKTEGKLAEIVKETLTDSGNNTRKLTKSESSVIGAASERNKDYILGEKQALRRERSKKEANTPKKLDREALLKKYRIKLPSEEMILRILESSGIKYQNIETRKYE